MFIYIFFNKRVVQRLGRAGIRRFRPRVGHRNSPFRGWDYMIPYMVGKLAPNSTHSTRGVVYVPNRGYFRAIPSQNGDKFVPSPPPSIVERVKRGEIRWFLLGYLEPYEAISDWPVSLPSFSIFLGEFGSHTPTHTLQKVQHTSSTSLTSRQFIGASSFCAATCGATSTTPLIEHAILQNNLPLHARKPQTTGPGVEAKM